MGGKNNELLSSVVCLSADVYVEKMSHTSGLLYITACHRTCEPQKYPIKLQSTKEINSLVYAINRHPQKILHISVLDTTDFDLR
jgi:hypothetical protein